MLKYCYEKWDKNKDKLENALRNDDRIGEHSYLDLLRITVKHILNNDNAPYSREWNTKRITQIDDGDYQGTLLFLIPEATYQPSEGEYLMTYIGYGSCGGCDVLQSIQPWEEGLPSEETVKNYMALCKDFITNMIKPYNHGWRQDGKFEQVTMNIEEDEE